MENIRPLTAEEREKALKEIEENADLFSARKTKHGIETGITDCKKEDIKQGLTTLVDNLLSMEKITIDDIIEIVSSKSDNAILITTHGDDIINSNLKYCDGETMVNMICSVIAGFSERVEIDPKDFLAVLISIMPIEINVIEKKEVTK